MKQELKQINNNNKRQQLKDNNKNLINIFYKTYYIYKAYTENAAADKDTIVSRYIYILYIYIYKIYIYNANATCD